ncbi:hypothetical protein ACWJ7M_003525 [Acinetobacter baumannii]
MKKIISMCLGVIIFPNIVLAAKPLSLIEVSQKFVNNKNYNEECHIDNFKIAKEDIYFNSRLSSMLNLFATIKVSDFDMGECIHAENFKDNLFFTHYWQKNKSIAGEKIDFYVVYDLKTRNAFGVIIDKDSKAYVLGWGQQDDMKKALKEYSEYSNDLKSIDLNSKLKFSDLENGYEPNKEPFVKAETGNKATNISKVESNLTQNKNNSLLKLNNEWNYGSCYKDRFNGAKICSIHNKNIMVAIINGEQKIYIGSNHYPGKKTAVKIDNGITYYGKEGYFNNSKVIIDEMKKGNIIYTRYVKWPYEYNVDSEISLIGFTNALNNLRQRYCEIK